MTHASSPASQQSAASRLAFLDPIRLGLTVLVILHHLSITFGGAGSWYYKETGVPELTRLLLTVFTATNQSFFMGFFFLIAGYLTPSTLARKGEAAFLGDRAVRLGVPILLFGYLLSPLTFALAIGAQGGDVGASLIRLIGENYFDLGPLWFNQALMLFTLIWLFAPRFTALERMMARVTVPHAGIAAGIAGWIALAFVLRLAVPVGQNVIGMQIGYFASYVILFFGGAWAASGRLLERVTLRLAAPWLVVSLIAFPTLWIYAGRSGAFSTNLWRGGWHLSALIYAAWEPLVATGIVVGALALARRIYPVGKPWLAHLARLSYAAFIIHPPVVVAVGWLAKDWSGAAAGRFLLAAPVACILTFVIADALSRGLAKIPVTRPARLAAQSHA